jgi:ribonuclease P protein component
VITPVRGRSTFRALSQAPLVRHGVVRARCVPSAVSPSTSVAERPEGQDARRGSSSVAYAIGRRQGSAVQRNRIRRRLRAAVREVDRRGTVLRPGVSYLLMSGPEASSCSFQDLVTWVEGALEQAGARSVRTVAVAVPAGPSPAGPAGTSVRNHLP